MKKAIISLVMLALLSTTVLGIGIGYTNQESLTIHHYLDGHPQSYSIRIRVHLTEKDLSNIDTVEMSTDIIRYWENGELKVLPHLPPEYIIMPDDIQNPTESNYYFNIPVNLPNDIPIGEYTNTVCAVGRTTPNGGIGINTGACANIKTYVKELPQECDLSTMSVRELLNLKQQIRLLLLNQRSRSSRRYRSR